MMDESDVLPPVNEQQRIKALQLVVRADGYLSQRKLLKALNLYKDSAEILPDPAIIRKIKKLRKYMKRNNMDLGENKENVIENKSFEKHISPDTSTAAQLNTEKTLKEHANFGISSDHSTKDDSKLTKVTPDKVPVFKSESPCVEKLGATAESNNVKMVSGSSNAFPRDNGENKSEHKRYVHHQKLRLSSSELSPKSPLAKNNRRASLSKMAPPEKANSATDNKISPNSDEPIRSFKDLRKRMYPHQKEGMKWLARLFGERKGGILGDDMGLGKTLQVIGYLYKMFEVNEIEHVLIVLPTALALPWQSEIKRWAPNLNFALYHGKTKASRMKLLHNLQRQGGLLLTTYGLIVTNYEELSKGPDGREFIWDYVFLDEGHKIKNPTKTQKAAHYIPAHNRIIITGTPIQNNLIELWSLFDFVHHGSLLGTIKTFKINYENPITRARQKDASLEEKQLGYRMSKNLQKIIAPYFLRRTKAELMADPNSGLPTLPRKNDIIVWVKLTADQKRVYESYLKLDEVKELMHSSRSPLVALNILKKLCDHLRLLSVRICKALGMLTSSESSKYAQDGLSHLDDPNEVPEWTRQAGTDEPSNLASSKASKEMHCAATQLNGIPDSLLYKESSKLMVVIELVGYLSATGHKCLVFSQSSKMLDIIQQILGNLRYKHVRMDGQITNLEQRAEIIRQFETDKDIHIFLLTTQVGGVGLNLTVADRIIIVDPSWNPAIDSQAVDRVYRIGQNKNVIIFRLITCGSVEEKIYIRQLFKLSINKQTTKESKDPFRYFTKQDLKQLFIVDDLSVSETQIQLAQMHSSKRMSDEVVDDQIKFLESMDCVFGISDHDLVFSTEDADQEIKMTNTRLQTMVEKAEEAIRKEINEESRANSKKIVPGIQERRTPSIESWTSQPQKSFNSPLFNMYGDEENEPSGSGQREVRHRRSNVEPHSISPSSDEVIILNDEERTAPPPHVNNNNNNKGDNNADDDVIILSDGPSDANDDDDNNEVVMDSEDEQSADLRRRTFSTFNKPKNDDKATAGVCEPMSSKTKAQDFDTPSNKNTNLTPNTNLTLANMTLMQTAADSPLSPRKAELKNVLVVDSPDNFTKSMSSGSQHLSDSLSPSNSAKFTVAESDYESDDDVLDSQGEEETGESAKSIEASAVTEDDSREFRSPVFRDVSVVVPDSSPRPAGLLPEEDKTGSPLSTNQFARSEESDKECVASEMHSLTEQLHCNLSIDNSIIVGSVRRNKRKNRVLSSSESEAEDEEPEDDEPRSVSGSFTSAGDSNNKDFGNAEDAPRSVSGSFVCAGDSNAKGDLSPDDNKDSGNANSSRTSSSSSASHKGRKRPNPLSSDSDSSDKEGRQSASASPFSCSDDLRNRLQSRETRKPKRFILSSDDDDDDDDKNDNDDDVRSEDVDNSLVVMEELNISVNPSEPLIHCIKTPPAKVARSYFSGRKKSLPSLSFGDPRSPSAKSLPETGSTLRSRLDECEVKDMESDGDEDGGNSSIEHEEEEEEEGESLGDEDSEDEDDDDSEDDDYFDDEDDDDDDDDDNVELPVSSPQKTDLYNQYINASRDAYMAKNYVTALKQALLALQQDSSDIKLQMYTLSLRKMTKK